MIDDLFNRIHLGYVWMFVTDKCNLDCDYCFFQNRKKTTTIEFSRIVSLLDKLPKTGKYDLVLSGGEPLICWGLCKDLIEYLRGNHPDRNIILQSNMLLFDEAKAELCQRNNVVIQPGIDGGFLSNFRHRKGVDQKRFERLLKNVKLLVTHDLAICASMTVHPDEVRDIFENFSALVGLGLNDIEVHPAFLAPWTKEKGLEFIRQYKKIVQYEREKKKQLLCRNYSMPRSVQQTDLVIQPDGRILPNWTYLSFPPKIREKYFIMKITQSGVDVFSSQFLEYLKRLKEFDTGDKTYRDFSNFNAAYVIEEIRDSRLKAKFLAYKELCKDIQDIDQIILEGKGI